MGLDSFLTKKTYVKQWSHETPEEKFSVSVRRGGKPFKAINSKRISYVEEEVAYWRKANQIHNWFVQNVQGGNDDCGTHYVSGEQLGELLSTIKTVLASCKMVSGKIHVGTSYDKNGKHEEFADGKIIENSSVAEELLPSTSGFFFGSTEYNEWYVKDLEYTEKVLTEILAEDDPNGEFYYSSSW
jgi:hypothetical protein